jgi:predicted nuclease with TOPRIM domain
MLKKKHALRYVYVHVYSMMNREKTLIEELDGMRVHNQELVNENNRVTSDYAAVSKQLELTRTRLEEELTECRAALGVAVSAHRKCHMELEEHTEAHDRAVRDTQNVIKNMEIAYRAEIDRYGRRNVYVCMYNN